MSVMLERCPEMAEWPPRWRAAAICYARGMTEAAIQKLGLMNERSFRRGKNRGTKWFTSDEFQMVVLRLQDLIFCSRGMWLAWAKKELEKKKRDDSPTAARLMDLVEKLIDGSSSESRMRGSVSLDLEGAFDPDIMEAGTDALRKMLAGEGHAGGNGDLKKDGDGVEEMMKNGPAETD